jgi:hypothetical protein
MSSHPDPVGAYRQAVEERQRPMQIVEAARRCPQLSVDEAMPALLALTDHRSNNLFERTAERWIERYESEINPTPSNGELALIRGAIATLPGWDATAGVGAEALERLLELRGMEFARAAVVRWIERLPTAR